MLQHPSLAAFSRHMLPRSQDSELNILLKDIHRLMPWHSHILPAAVLAGVNRIIADSSRGQTVFLPFYAMPPLVEQTGLFFFRGRPDGPFALICPGGGFQYVGSLHKGFPLPLVLDLPKPACVVMAYTGHDWITKAEPHTFAVGAKDDPIASAYVMNERINALKQNGTDAEIMIFNHAGHGFGTGEGTEAAGWIDAAIKFWERQLKRLGIKM